MVDAKCMLLTQTKMFLLKLTHREMSSISLCVNVSLCLSISQILCTNNTSHNKYPKRKCEDEPELRLRAVAPPGLSSSGCLFFIFLSALTTHTDDLVLRATLEKQSASINSTVCSKS